MKFLLTNKRNVPLSSCFIWFQLFLSRKTSRFRWVRRDNPPFLFLNPSRRLLTVALIQRRNVIVLAAVRRRVVINSRLLTVLVVRHLRNQPTYGVKIVQCLGTPRNLAGKIESQKNIVQSGKSKRNVRIVVANVVDLKVRATLKASTQRENPLFRFNYSESS